MKSVTELQKLSGNSAISGTNSNRHYTEPAMLKLIGSRVALLALVACACVLCIFFFPSTKLLVSRENQLPSPYPTKLPYRRIGNICQSRIREPSGITYHPKRKSLFVIGDEGHLYEMTMDGKVIRSKRLKRKDLEGLTVNPSNGHLYAVVEGDDAILEIDQNSLRIIRKFEINRKFNGQELLKKRGNGLEAIVFVPDPSHPEGGTFWVGNQSFDLRLGKEPSVVCQINIPLRSSRKKKAKGKIIRFFSMDTIDISGLTYDTRRNRLVVINDKPNLLQEVKYDGQVLHQYQLPGKDQEGVALDTMGYIYIAQENGEIIKFKPR